MKITLSTAAFLVASLAGPTLARENPAPPATRSLYTCSGSTLSRVAYSEAPAPCCEGMLSCPRLLGSSGMERPKPNNRT